MTVIGLALVAACKKETPPPTYQSLPIVHRDIVVSAQASGEILDLAVETGQAVKRGDLMVRVDPRIPKNAVAQAQADLEVAQAQADLEVAQARLTRRDFFRLGVVAGPASVVAACGWDGGPALEPKLRAFSRINDWVGEKVLFSPRRMAREYPVSARTPMQNFPAYSITYNRTRSFPAVDNLRDWRLEVGGLVRNPIRLTLQALETLPSLTYTVKHHCVEGWTAIGTWTGVPLSTVVALAQPKPEARYLRFDSFDSRYYNGWDLSSAMHPQTILAYAYNDRPLGMNRGAPLRLYSPVKLGYKLTKYLSAATLTRDQPGGYWEDQGYPWFGGV